MNVTADPAVLPEVHYDGDCAPDELAHVMMALDRWSGRTAQHVNHLRSADRHEYRGAVTIERDCSSDAEPPACRQLLHVTSRNVSKTGLGIVVPPRFVPRLLSDATPLLRSEDIFKAGAEIRVTLGSNGQMPAIHAVVTRLRPVHLGFFEVGVKFVARAAGNQSA